MSQHSIILLIFLLGQAMVRGQGPDAGGTNTPPPLPLSIYENNAPFFFGELSPQIDANIFINRSMFQVGFSSVDAVQFDTQNTFIYTNAGSGTMLGFPGFRFDFVDPSTNSPARRPADWFVNFNQVVGQNHVHIYSTNIISPGELAVGPGGTLLINGLDVNLNRGSLRAGVHPVWGFAPFTLTGLNLYENPAGIEDLYWAVGFNNVLSGDPRRLTLDNTTNEIPNFHLPNPQSPSHQVQGPYNNSILNISLPNFGFFTGTNFFSKSYDAWAFYTVTGPTNDVVQVVFAPTNSGLANLSVDVRFGFGDFTTGDPDGLGRAAIVRFQSTAIDPILEEPVVESFYFIDDSAFDSSISLSTEVAGPGRRPNSYLLARDFPNFDFALAPNTNYTPSLLYTNTYRTNEVDIRYVAYGVELGFAPQSAFGFFTPFQRVPLDPTNMPGRVEINGGIVDMEQARVRAETFFRLRATNDLVLNALPLIDAPFISLDITSISPTLTMSNIAPVSVGRLHGQLGAWTALWTNVVTNFTFDVTGTNITATNLIQRRFHVLMLDHNLQSQQGVLTTDLLLRNTNVVFNDSFNVVRQFRVDASSLSVLAGASLLLPTNSSLTVTNFYSGATTTEVRRLVFGNRYETNFIVRHGAPSSFTNQGQVIIPEIASFSGAQFSTTNGMLQYFVNDGQLSAASLFVASTNLIVSGTLNPSQLRATDGTLALVANDLLLSNALLASSGDVDIKAANAEFSGSFITAGGTNTLGRILLNVSNSVVSSGSNNWITTGGFQAGIKPATGDLLNTRIESQAGRRNVAFHSWAGENRGATTAGFVNNLALGHLVLNGEPLSLFTFSPLTGQDNALYVDYLEFQGSALTNSETSLRVNSGFTIYFANANLPAEKLEADFPGRLVWVPEFLGPNSTTNIVYPDGRTNSFNTALAQSCDRNDDGDCLANCIDPTPFPDRDGVIFADPCVTEPAMIAIQLSPAKSSVTLEWIGVQNKNNFVEYKDTVGGTNWLRLTNIFIGASSQKITVQDPLSTNGSRLYRVKVQ